MNLTARDRSSLSRQELFCSLALVAFAQSNPSEDLSIENLSNSLPSLPLPRISIPSPSPSYIPEESPAALPDVPEASSSSPWGDGPTTPGLGLGRTNGHYPEPSDFSTTTTTAEDDRPGAFSVGTERGYWKRLEHVEVGLITEKEGWFLQKYRVESDVSHPARSHESGMKVTMMWWADESRSGLERGCRDDTLILSGCSIA